jgi:putative transposase
MVVSDKYQGYRIPKSIIGYAVRKYYRYKLSIRDVSEMLLERGVEFSYEIVRKWGKISGTVFARGIRRKKGSSFKDKWHIDEMHLLFLKKALKTSGFVSRVYADPYKSDHYMVADKLRSYRKAHGVVCKSGEHRSPKCLYNIIEKSHQATGEKERQIRRFKDQGSTQRFLATLGTFLNLLKVSLYKHPAKVYRRGFKTAFQIFDEIVLSSPISPKIQNRGTYQIFFQNKLTVP